MSEHASIGIDIGGTKTLCVLVNEKLELLARIKFKTEPNQGQKRFTSELISAVKNLKRAARHKKLTPIGVGIGFAGHVDKAKCVVKAAPNILCVGKLPHRQDHPRVDRAGLCHRQ